MNACIESPLTLEEVAEHFEQWRSSKSKGERIPEQLWSEAIGLVGPYRISQVTRTLRLSGTDLNKRRGLVGAEQRRQRPEGKTAFVEIDPGLVDRSLGVERTEVWMELTRPDGLRLRIRPSGGADLLALVDRFLEA